MGKTPDRSCAAEESTLCRDVRWLFSGRRPENRAIRQKKRMTDEYRGALLNRPPLRVHRLGPSFEGSFGPDGDTVRTVDSSGTSAGGLLEGRHRRGGPRRPVFLQAE